jgi:hypothetical protein
LHQASMSLLPPDAKGDIIFHKLQADKPGLHRRVENSDRLDAQSHHAGIRARGSGKPKRFHPSPTARVMTCAGCGLAVCRIATEWTRATCRCTSAAKASSEPFRAI